MTDVFSWGDSDPFEEDDSWMSEPESVCNNWRGWKKLPANANVGQNGNTNAGGPPAVSAGGASTSASGSVPGPSSSLPHHLAYAQAVASAMAAGSNNGRSAAATTSNRVTHGSGGSVAATVGSSGSTAASSMAATAGAASSNGTTAATVASSSNGSVAGGAVNSATNAATSIIPHRPSSPSFAILSSTFDGDVVPPLAELAARVVAVYIPFEVVEHLASPVPEQLQLRITYWSFPNNEEDIRLYSCLANGSADEFQKGESLYRGRAVQNLLQIGFHLSATVVGPSIKICTVSVNFDRKRITKCSCTCSCPSSWCSHVVAVCLHRIYQPTAVCLRAPISESLSRLRGDQLLKFAQYLISEFPQQILPTAQRLLDDLLLNENSTINMFRGAPDPTAGGSIHDQTKWCLDEHQLHDNIRKIVIKLCIPSPMVYSDVNYLSSTAPPAASEWTSLLRPLRGREPEGLWNLLSIVREMLRRHDRNSIPLLRILTEEILTCDQILLWWFNTNVSLNRGYPPNSTGYSTNAANSSSGPSGSGSNGGSGSGSNNNRSSIHSNMHTSQHACSSLCEEIVVLWRLVTLNPALSSQETQYLFEQLREYHLQTLSRVIKFRPSAVHPQIPSNTQQGGGGGGSANNSSNSNRTSDVEIFSGFKPAMISCLIDWTSYPIQGVTNRFNRYSSPFCAPINAQNTGSGSNYNGVGSVQHAISGTVKYYPPWPRMEYSAGVRAAPGPSSASSSHHSHNMSLRQRLAAHHVSGGGSSSRQAQFSSSSDDNEAVVGGGGGGGNARVSGVRRNDNSNDNSEDSGMNNDRDWDRASSISTSSSSGSGNSSVGGSRSDDDDDDDDQDGDQDVLQRQRQAAVNRLQQMIQAQPDDVRPARQELNDDYQIYVYNTRANSVNANDKQNGSSNDPLKKRYEPVLLAAAQVKPIEDSYEILFSRAEALYAHGYVYESCQLSIRLAEQLLSQPPVLQLDSNSTINSSGDSGLTNPNSNQPRTNLLSKRSGRSRFNPVLHQISLLASATLSKSAFLCQVLSENEDCHLLAFHVGLFGLELVRPPASTKALEVKLANQEQELANSLKRIPLCSRALAVLREKAEQLRDGRMTTRGDALLPLILASYIFDALVLAGNTRSAASSLNGSDRYNNSSGNGLHTSFCANTVRLSTDERLGFDAAVAAIGLKANVAEAEHPLLCEGTRRQRGDLALTLLVHYKDNKDRLAMIMDKLLDKDIHQIHRKPSGSDGNSGSGSSNHHSGNFMVTGADFQSQSNSDATRALPLIATTPDASLVLHSTPLKTKRKLEHAINAANYSLNYQQSHPQLPQKSQSEVNASAEQDKNNSDAANSSGVATVVGKADNWDEDCSSWETKFRNMNLNNDETPSGSGSSNKPSVSSNATTEPIPIVGSRGNVSADSASAAETTSSDNSPTLSRRAMFVSSGSGNKQGATPGSDSGESSSDSFSSTYSTEQPPPPLTVNNNNQTGGESSQQTPNSSISTTTTSTSTTASSSSSATTTTVPTSSHSSSSFEPYTNSRKQSTYISWGNGGLSNSSTLISMPSVRSYQPPNGGVSGTKLTMNTPLNSLYSVVPPNVALKPMRYKGKRGHYPIIPNQPSEASAHFMFELAKTVLAKAGGNNTSVLFTQPPSTQNCRAPHRNLHMCAFQIGLYALGLHNAVSPNWLSRTYSSHVSWITGQAMEIGHQAIVFLINTWEGHLTPPEVASIADRASRVQEPQMVEVAARLALSCLPAAHALTPNEIQRALIQCKEQSNDMLERACLAVESAAQGGGVYPEVLFDVARKWYELYEIELRSSTDSTSDSCANPNQRSHHHRSSHSHHSHYHHHHHQQSTSMLESAASNENGDYSIDPSGAMVANDYMSAMVAAGFMVPPPHPSPALPGGQYVGADGVGAFGDVNLDPSSSIASNNGTTPLLQTPNSFAFPLQYYNPNQQTMPYAQYGYIQQQQPSFQHTHHRNGTTYYHHPGNRYYTSYPTVYQTNYQPPPTPTPATYGFAYHPMLHTSQAINKPSLTLSAPPLYLYASQPPPNLQTQPPSQSTASGTTRQQAAGQLILSHLNGGGASTFGSVSNNGGYSYMNTYPKSISNYLTSGPAVATGGGGGGGGGSSTYQQSTNSSNGNGNNSNGGGGGGNTGGVHHPLNHHQATSSRQANYMQAVYRVGMLAMDTLSRRVHDDRPQTKYSRTPSYGEDVKWLLYIAKKLGTTHVHEFCLCSQNAVASPFVLYDIIIEAAPALTGSGVPSSGNGGTGCSNSGGGGGSSGSGTSSNTFAVHNIRSHSVLGPLIHKCQQAFYDCLYFQLMHLNPSEYEDFLSNLRAARAAYHLMQNGQQFSKLLEQIKRNKNCKKDLCQMINSLMMQN